MQLIETYLFEIGRYLPQDQRDDILNELRTSLEEQVHEIAGTNSPSREHMETVIDQYGHPINVASAYKEPRYLIGPELYPAFKESLSTIITVSIVVLVSLQLLAWVTLGSGTKLTELAQNLLQISLWLVAVTVIVFATMEYYGERVDWYDSWKASSLPSSIPTTLNRSDVMTNLITEGVFLLWWNDVLKFQNWIPGYADRFVVQFSDFWAPLYWPLNLLVGTWFCVHAYTLIKGSWKRPALLAEITLSILGIAVCVGLIMAPQLVTISGEVDGRILIERSFKVTLLFIAGFIAWDGWQAVKKLKSVIGGHIQLQSNN